MKNESRLATISRESAQKTARVIGVFDGVAGRHDALQRGGLRGWLARRDDAALANLMESSPGQRVLEVGCGSGRHARSLSAQGLRVCAVDLSPRMVDLVRPHVEEAHVANIETLSLGRRFDRVFSVGLLDFVRDPALCVGRLAMHVQVGGRLVVEVPRWSLGGILYAVGYRLTRGIDVQLFLRRQLDAMVRPYHLYPSGQVNTFVHCMFAAWTRGPSSAR
jgi:2-polyprenyl-3-methyl-5-hydroxy-6-metoxy-1,4-benzoquinol methylase